MSNIRQADKSRSAAREWTYMPYSNMQRVTPALIMAHPHQSRVS